jgi:GTP-binding protein
MPAPAFCAPTSVVLRPSSASTAVSSRASAFAAASRLRPARLLTAPAVVVATAATETGVAKAAAEEFALTVREDIVSVSCVAHVDHGKSSLLDALLEAAGTFRENQVVEEQVLDSNDQERERGITILAKVASLVHNGIKVNVIDTPGHADFASEVERVLDMSDGVLLLVDSVEGPKPQTRFVLKKAIELGKKIALVINKMDRDGARPDFVLDATFDLFADLGASDEQMDFPVVYASAIKRMSGHDAAAPLENNMDAVFDVISKFPRPHVSLDAPLQLQIVNVDYDDFKGRLGVGRINAGKIRPGDSVTVCHPNREPVRAKIAELFIFDKLGRRNVDEAGAGDIIMFSGVPKFDIGDTLCAVNSPPNPMPAIQVEPPTVRMSFLVNTSEFAGQEGKYVTSRQIRDRLDKELERNVGLRLDEEASSPDRFELLGRGVLHLTVLIETMRREGFEMMIGPPSVIEKTVDGQRCEPFESFEAEVPQEYMGAVVDALNKRRGEMVDMGAVNNEGYSPVTFLVPTRGLMGIKNALLTATRGTCLMNTSFAGYKPYAGEIASREKGSLLAFETGKVTGFGLEKSQERGKNFSAPGDMVYKDQIVGIHQRPGDLQVNICKVKQLTNMRAASADSYSKMDARVEMSLDECLEYIGEGEVAEVTPVSIRLAKVAKAKRNNRG